MSSTRGSSMIIRIFGFAILGVILATASLSGSPSAVAGANGITLAQANSTGEEQAQKPAQSSSDQAVAPPPTLQEFVSDTRPVENLSAKELREKLRAGRALVKGGALSRPDKKRVASVLRVTRAQLNK